MVLELLLAAVATFSPPEPVIPLGALPHHGQSCLIQRCDPHVCALLVAPRARTPRAPRLRCGDHGRPQIAPRTVPITD